MKFMNAYEALTLLLSENEDLKSQEITINSRALKNEEAIGCPDRKDFPLLTGAEVLLQAEVGGALGQAFTSDPIAYEGSIQGILSLPLDRLGNQALLVAALNAVASKLAITHHTIHCIDNQPEECAREISQDVLARHGLCNIGILGYQPAILENCVKVFGADRVNITDLNPDNIGTIHYNVTVLDGFSDTKKMLDSSDVLLITGSILANGTYENILGEIGNKPYYFFGTTCAALASLNKINRLCPLSK